MNDSLDGGGGGQTPVHPDDLDGLRPRWIRTQTQLDEVERDNLLRGTRWARSRARSLPALLDDRFLRRLHLQCFGDVWSWAGQYRTRATSIGIESLLVAPAVRDLMADARLWFDEPRAGNMPEDLARLHHRLVAIHPYANGNGRTARLFADLIALRVGVSAPTWGAGRGSARGDYLAALRAADSGDLGPLVEFLWSS